MRFKSQEELLKWIAKSKAAPNTAPQKPRANNSTPQPDPVNPNIQRRILGVDTALRCTGWGIIDVRGNSMKAVDCGVIKTQPREKISECLRRLAGGIRELAQLYHPDIAVLEGAFYFKNARTAMLLGSARGAVISVLAELDIPMHEYAPRRIKQSVCGFGNASKQQVALLVSQFLSIKTTQIALDSTDALAMAICHAQNITTSGGLNIPPQI